MKKQSRCARTHWKQHEDPKAAGVRHKDLQRQSPKCSGGGPKDSRRETSPSFGVS